MCLRVQLCNQHCVWAREHVPECLSASVLLAQTTPWHTHPERDKISLVVVQNAFRIGCNDVYCRPYDADCAPACAPVFYERYNGM